MRPSVPTSTRTLPFATTAVRPHRRSDTQLGYPPRRSSTSKDTPPYPPSLTTAFSPGNLDSSSAEALKTHSQHFTTHSHTLRIGHKTPRGEIRHSRVHTHLTLHYTTLPRLGERRTTKKPIESTRNEQKEFFLSARLGGTHIYTRNPKVQCQKARRQLARPSGLT